LVLWVKVGLRGPLVRPVGHVGFTVLGWPWWRKRPANPVVGVCWKSLVIVEPWMVVFGDIELFNNLGRVQWSIFPKLRLLGVIQPV
jgi:hypothetical protein